MGPHLPALAIVLVALAGPIAAAPDPESLPAAVRLSALRAVEGDSVPVVAARWRAAPRDLASRLGLGTVAALAYDRATAERTLRPLVEASTPAAYRAHALLALGWMTFDSGDFVEAPRLFASARDVARGAAASWGRSVEAEALVGLSRITGPQAPVVALAWLDTAERLAGRDEIALLAAVRAQRAYLLASKSDPRAAVEVTAAVALARRAGAPRQEALAVYARAADYRLRHLADSADAAYRDAARRQELVHDRAMRANTLVSIADLLRQKEDLVGARVVLHDAEREAVASGNRRAMTRVNLGLGVIAAAFRDHAGAASRFSAAAANAIALGDTSSLLTTRAYQGFHYLDTGELERAREVSSWARDRFRGAERWYETVLVTQQLAAVETRRRDFEAAERLLQDADTTARHHGLGFLADYQARDRGRLELARGRFTEAHAHFTRLLPQLGEQEAVTRYLAKLSIAEADAALGAGERAEREALDAAAELDRWRAGLSDAEQRLLAFQTEDGTADRDAVAAGTVAALVGAGRVSGAFRLAEHRRARVLAERVLRAGTSRPAARADSSSTARDTVALDVLARSLPDERTALLEYVTGGWGTPTTLFVLRRSGGRTLLSAQRLVPTDSLIDRIARLSALLASGNDPSALSRELGIALLGPALPSLGPEVSRLVIVADGPLHDIPFDALRLADGRFVIERFVVGTTPSAAVLAALRARPALDTTKTRLLAVADPRFTEADARGSGSAAYRDAFDSTGGLPRLPSSADEARLVARYADAADVRLRADASAAFLRHATLRDYAVLHFATHALVDDRSGEHSALALSPSDGDAGFVTASELANLDLRADLVVLSACRSAGGQLVGGEGILGLSSPLLVAGARSVVATAWHIKDRETVPFVRALYDALAAGQPVADALRAAKLDAIRRGAPPAEWAAFQAMGDPFVRVPLHAPRRSAPWTAMIAVMVVLAAAVIFYGVRSRSGRASELTRAPSSV